ncbi:MAG: hypothetical protein GY711_33195 [bacterium]|nr:hypothetical protein [bacterium]
MTALALTLVAGACGRSEEAALPDVDTTETPTERVPIGAGRDAWLAASRVGCIFVWDVSAAKIGADLTDIRVDGVAVAFGFDPSSHASLEVGVKTPTGDWVPISGAVQPVAPGHSVWKGTSDDPALVGAAASHTPDYPIGTWQVRLANDDNCIDLKEVSLLLTGSGTR